MIQSLLHSRKFWLTVVAILQTVLLQYFEVAPEIWEAINTILMFLIGMIAVEDAATKLKG